MDLKKQKQRWRLIKIHEVEMTCCLLYYRCKYWVIWAKYSSSPKGRQDGSCINLLSWITKFWISITWRFSEIYVYPRYIKFGSRINVAFTRKAWNEMGATKQSWSVFVWLFFRPLVLIYWVDLLVPAGLYHVCKPPNIWGNQQLNVHLAIGCKNVKTHKRRDKKERNMKRNKGIGAVPISGV